MINRNLFRNAFKIILIIGVIIMAGYWYKKFAIEDKDNGNVDYESLEQTFDIQPPAVSLCLASPFLEKKNKRS